MEDQLDYKQRFEEEKRLNNELKHQRNETSLAEYLLLWDQHLSGSVSIDPDTTVRTKGTAQNTENRYRPDSIKPWEDYLQKHRDTLEGLDSVYHHQRHTQFLPSRDYVRLQAPEVDPVASHADLETIVRTIFEVPMKKIMRHLSSVHDNFWVPETFEFRNNRTVLGEDSETTPRPNRPSRSGNPDQYCTYVTGQGRRKVAFTAEFKPPHKLSPKQLQSVLGPNRPIDVGEIVDAIKTPTDEDARYEHNAKTQVVAVIVQAFSYMVTNEVQYGYIHTGNALVFLHIRLEEDMQTVYYHLLETDRKDPSANESPQHDDVASLSALHNIVLTHLMTFSIHALAAAKQELQWREHILPKLKTWYRDDQTVYDQEPPTPSTAGKSSVGYEPDSDDPPDDSPSEHRRKSQKQKKKKSGPTSQPTSRYRPDTPPPPDDPDNRRVTRSGAKQGQQSRSSGAKQGQQSRSSGAKQGQQSRSSGAEQGQQSRSSGKTPSYTMKEENRNPYCTQRCLQGLTQGGPLDLSCPNVSKHCHEGHQGDRHQLSCEQFRLLLEQQLRRCYGADFRELGLQGARGALFKVTLTSHAYTVVAKGTVGRYVQYLRHEADVYRRLVAIQGVHVPVFLGSLDLDYAFYCNWGIQITHMMFLSWAGESLYGNTLTLAEKQTRASEITRAVTAVHEAGILHRDVRMPNVLWNDELKQPMLIDFERAIIVKAVSRPALLSLATSKKRKRVGEEKHNHLQKCGQRMHDKNKVQEEKHDQKKYDNNKGQEGMDARFVEAAIMKKDPRNRLQARKDLVDALYIL